jgi:hypothetical protein
VVGSRRVRLAAAMAAILAGAAVAGCLAPPALVEQGLFCVQPRSNDAAVQVWCHRAIDQEQAEPDETEHVDLMAGPWGEVRFARATFDRVDVTGPDRDREARLQELLDASFLHI